jgi:hypothetical protein
LTITTDRPATSVSDPRTLIPAETFDKIARYYAAKAEVTQTYAERATGQFLVFLKAHADVNGDADFGLLLPTGESYRVVPTRPVDAVWHSALQISEPYTAACEQIAGGYVHHRPILTEAMQDGTAMTYTLAALHATGYHVDLEFWNAEAESCCPPNPPQPGIAG